MNTEDLLLAGVCATLMALGAIALAALIVRRVACRRRASDDAQRESLRQDVTDLVAQLDRLAGQIEGKVDRCLLELRGALDEAGRRVADLRRIDRPAEATPATPPDTSTPACDNHSRQADIVRLACQGVEAVEIARRLNLHVGEVELTLGLHRLAGERPRRE